MRAFARLHCAERRAAPELVVVGDGGEARPVLLGDVGNEGWPRRHKLLLADLDGAGQRDDGGDGGVRGVRGRLGHGNDGGVPIHWSKTKSAELQKVDVLKKRWRLEIIGL